MKNLLKLLGQLWNSEKNAYSECEHPILQRAIDYIKNKYVHLNVQVEGYYNIIEMDLPLQRRRVGHLMKKIYGVSI
ncbi:MAG: hypothetical protein PHH54_00875 [Candidatus Nanoarchaeia archaeon]|nr:hypothetical protein [Candidatus Nanoarchaeia archaeon]MDD5740516.1 hypothetical protein [Candidatus Nanoarchaeia archaeon]